MSQLDPFYLFRTMLFVGLSVYYILATSVTIWRLVTLLRGRDRAHRLLRTVVSYQLVTIRLRPLAGELVQIGFLIVVLVVLWWAHGLV